MDLARLQYEQASNRHSMALSTFREAKRNEHICQEEYRALSEQYISLKLLMRKVKSRLKTKQEETREAKHEANLAAFSLSHTQEVLKGEEMTLSSLPVEILIKIFMFLDNNEIALNVAAVNPRLNIVARDKSLWRNVRINKMKCQELTVVYLLQEFCKDNMVKFTLFCDVSGISIVTDYTFRALQNFCPNLQSLKLSNIQLGSPNPLSISLHNLSYIEFQGVQIFFVNFPSLQNSTKLSRILLRNTRIGHLKLIQNLPPTICKLDLDTDALLPNQAHVVHNVVSLEKRLDELKKHLPNCIIIRNP